jgi:CTP:molybdopterin cytidylyltransferase MocA
VSVNRRAGARIGIVLAAGAGRRMGGPKAILEFHGVPLVAHVARTALDGGCEQVVVVLGAGAEKARPFAEAVGAMTVVNPRWEEGMGRSLEVGLATAAAVAPEAGAALVLLVDQPFISASAVSAVLSAQRDPEHAGILAAAAYDGRRGHPVLIGREHWPALRATLSGDEGARAFLHEHRNEVILVPCDTVADPRDLDVPGDLPRES